jgi:hypothetical protein
MDRATGGPIDTDDLVVALTPVQALTVLAVLVLAILIIRARRAR